jgi:hypothetical protein
MPTPISSGLPSIMRDALGAISGLRVRITIEVPEDELWIHPAAYDLLQRASLETAFVESAGPSGTKEMPDRNPTSDKTTKCLVCAGTGIMELRVEDGACQLIACDVFAREFD